MICVDFVVVLYARGKFSRVQTRKSANSDRPWIDIWSFLFDLNQ